MVGMREELSGEGWEQIWGVLSENRGRQLPTEMSCVWGDVQGREPCTEGALERVMLREKPVRRHESEELSAGGRVLWEGTSAGRVALSRRRLGTGITGVEAVVGPVSHLKTC